MRTLSYYSYTGTWASRPAASASTGNVILITDVGAGNRSEWYSDGVDWRPVNGRLLLAQSSVAQTAITGVVVWTVAASYTLQGGVMGLNGAIHTESIWTYTGLSAIKTPATRLAATQFGDASNSAATTDTRHTSVFANRNSASLQVGPSGGLTFPGMGNGTSSALRTGTVNTATDQTVSIGIVPGAAGDSAVLQRYAIWLDH